MTKKVKENDSLQRLTPLKEILLTESRTVCDVLPGGGGSSNRLRSGDGGRKPYEQTGKYPIEMYDIGFGVGVLVKRVGYPSEIIYPGAVFKAVLADEVVEAVKAPPEKKEEDPFLTKQKEELLKKIK